MVVNVSSYLSWSAHQVFTLTIKLIKTVKWGTGQLLSLTVELGWNLKADSKDIAHTRIDRTRKIPFTTLVRALGFSGDDEIFDIFGDSELVRNTVEKDIHRTQ